MKIKFVAVAVAMLLSISVANAEIATLVKSVSDNTVKLPNGMQCFVQERAFFGSGDKSPLSEYFANSGLVISDDKSAPCSIVVGASVSLPLNPSDPKSVKPLPVKLILSNQDRQNRTVDAALQSTTLAQEASEQDKAVHTYGESIGAGIGSQWGLGIGTGLTMLGSLLDDKKKELPAGVATVYADLKFKDEQGKTRSTDVVVYAASTTKELPLDLLRAAVKRVVVEIQTQPATPNNVDASATAEIPRQEVH